MSEVDIVIGASRQQRIGQPWQRRATLRANRSGLYGKPRAGSTITSLRIAHRSAPVDRAQRLSRVGPRASVPLGDGPPAPRRVARRSHVRFDLVFGYLCDG